VAVVLSYLDGGEAEAITLALEQPGTLLLMDDRHGTVEARKQGLEVVGTLAVLDRAAARGWIDLQEMFRRLRSSTFRFYCPYAANPTEKADKTRVFGPKMVPTK
jgi:predicted nucleic acid-binding protein